MEDPGKWSVDKRIPVPSIIAAAVFLILQTWYFATAFSGLNYRVTALEEASKVAQPQTAQIAVMQEKVSTMQLTLNKIESWLAMLRNQGNAPFHQ